MIGEPAFIVYVMYVSNEEVMFSTQFFKINFHRKCTLVQLTPTDEMYLEKYADKELSRRSVIQYTRDYSRTPTPDLLALSRAMLASEILQRAKATLFYPSGDDTLLCSVTRLGHRSKVRIHGVTFYFCLFSG